MSADQITREDLAEAVRYLQNCPVEAKPRFITINWRDYIDFSYWGDREGAATAKSILEEEFELGFELEGFERDELGVLYAEGSMRGVPLRVKLPRRKD